jgi:hypothetical protein
MGRLSRDKLEEAFKVNLSDVWETWDEYFEDDPGTPFENVHKFYDSDMESMDLCALLGKISYVQGIHDALGWSLDNPRGPREWGPGR